MTNVRKIQSEVGPYLRSLTVSSFALPPGAGVPCLARGGRLPGGGCMKFTALVLLSTVLETSRSFRCRKVFVQERRM